VSVWGRDVDRWGKRLEHVPLQIRQDDLRGPRSVLEIQHDVIDADILEPMQEIA
jgi:hypothetical protein